MEVEARSILTRCSGYLRQVCSHSLNPYRGCTFGRSLCGQACYVQHNRHITAGRPWGSFLEAKVNAAQCYLKEVDRERRWAHHLSIFMSSATDPFLPQEKQFNITRSLLRAMLEKPPDELIVQTHSDLVTRESETLWQLSRLCRLRIHLSIEGDRERLPGLPPPACSLERRLQAAAHLKSRGLRTVATLSPLHPLADPEAFFLRLQACVDAVVIDHFVGGDGTPNGSRTRRTALPAAMQALHPESTSLAYRDQVVQQARAYFPGRVGVGAAGFAAQYS